MAAAASGTSMDESIKSFTIGGFSGATFTPMSADGLTVDLDAIGPYAEFLATHGLHCVFINGTSGESMSLSTEERKAITERWVKEGAKQTPRIRVIAHIGSDSLTATMDLARHAESVGVDAISAMTPIMFKPSTPAALAAWVKQVCSAAPATPFYYYHFPAITGLQLDALAFLKAVEEAVIPTFRGFKFTDFNLFAYESCLTHNGGVYDVCYGRDEAALGGMAVGAPGHVGNGFCFAIGPFNRMRAAFRAGDLETARLEQNRVNKVVQLIFDPKLGAPVAVAKAIQSARGIDMGPVRLPNLPLSEEKLKMINDSLTSMGFFEWCD